MIYTTSYTITSIGIMKLYLTQLCGLLVCHGDPNKQDYLHCISVRKARRYSVSVGTPCTSVHGCMKCSILFIGRCSFVL